LISPPSKPRNSSPVAIGSSVDGNGSSSKFGIISVGVILELLESITAKYALIIPDANKKTIIKLIKTSFDFIRFLPHFRITKSFIVSFYYKYKLEHHFNCYLKISKFPILIANFILIKNENGRELDDKIELWIGYNLCVNVENSKFQFEPYGVSKNLN